MNALTAFKLIFSLDDDSYLLAFEKCGGLDMLETLQYSQSEKVYETSSQLLEQHFGGEEVDKTKADMNDNVSED